MALQGHCDTKKTPKMYTHPKPGNLGDIRLKWNSLFPSYTQESKYHVCVCCSALMDEGLGNIFTPQTWELCEDQRFSEAPPLAFRCFDLDQFLMIEKFNT